MVKETNLIYKKEHKIENITNFLDKEKERQTNLYNELVKEFIKENHIIEDIEDRTIKFFENNNSDESFIMYFCEKGNTLLKHKFGSSIKDIKIGTFLKNNLNKKVKQNKLSKARFREALIKKINSELKTLYSPYYSDGLSHKGDYIKISLK